MFRSNLTFFLFFLSLNSPGQLQPIGQWREHLPYASAIRTVAAGKKIYCATPYSIFSYDPAANEISRYSKINGLAEVGISTIAWDDAGKKLFVAYANSNIDIISEKRISNLNDIKRKNITSDKTIYDINFFEGRAYLSTGFGIVVVDPEKVETIDTYIIGNTGNNIRVNGVSVSVNEIVAGSAEGIKVAPRTLDPSDHRNWRTIRNGYIKDLKLFQGRIIFNQNDSLFVLNGTTVAFFYTSGWQITNMSVSGDRLVLSENKTGVDGQVVSLKPDGTTDRIFSFTGILKLPQQAMLFNGEYWIADLFGGLEKATANSIEKTIPNSPFEISSGQMYMYNNRLLVAAGAVNAAWNYTFSPFGLFTFENEKWNYYNKYNFPALDSVSDIITVTVDRRNSDVYYGSFGGGLVRLAANNTLTLFKQSLLSPATGDPGSYRVAGLAFDESDNLWISNFGSPAPVVVRKADGTKRAFSTPYNLFQNAVSQIKIDRSGQKWIVSPKGNGLIFLNSGNIDDPADDKWKLFRTGAGNGNLPDNQVYCVEIDRDGFVWVGTGKGIAIIPCAGENANCDAYLPVVKSGSTAGYLLQNETVLAIATDGANRKWVGTASGLWLVTSDGEMILDHYTEDNSPLLGNIIKAIAIDQKSGEVIIETNNGICTYRGWATETQGLQKEILVYPNPVPPGYNGFIGIRGLADNSLVRITELNGRLVCETRCLGGQAVWNGKDSKGSKVSSGVYLVLANNKVVSKIFFIQ